MSIRIVRVGLKAKRGGAAWLRGRSASARRSGWAGVGVGLVVALAPIEGPTPQASLTLGILAWAIVWWVAGVFHETVTALIMAVLFLAVANVPTDRVFEAFSGSTWWLLMAAFGLGLGMKESGLVDRIALAILTRFPARFESQAFALMAAGTVVGPLIPSMTAKLAVLEPLALGISDSLGYPRKERGANGLFLAALVGVRNIGPAVISASIIGYALVALYPESVREQFNMVTWFLSALPWFAVVSVLNFVAIVALYKPKGERAEGAGAADAGAPSASPAAREGRGPLSSKEKKMLAIIVATVTLWVLEPFHGIEASTVTLGALCLCLACGIFDLKRFRSGMNWESLFFIGIVMGLSPVFAYTGVDQWVVGIFGPVMEGLAFSPYAFVLGIAVVTVLLRFVIVSEMAFVSIFMAFMLPMSLSLGINPWVVGFAVYALVNPWFTLYQNPVYLAAFYSVDGQMVRHADMAKYCVLYVAICMAGLAVSVPYWQMLGLFSL